MSISGSNFIVRDVNLDSVASWDAPRLQVRSSNDAAVSTSTSLSTPRSATAPATVSGLIGGYKKAATLTAAGVMPGSLSRLSPTLTATAIRRSASFDTIATSYLLGRWPHLHHNHQQHQLPPPQPHRSPNIFRERRGAYQVGDDCSCSVALATDDVIQMNASSVKSDKSTQTFGEVDDSEGEKVGHRTSSQRGSLSSPCSTSSSNTAVRDLRGRSIKNHRSPMRMVSSECIAIPLCTSQRDQDLATHSRDSAESFSQELERLVRDGDCADNEYSVMQVAAVLDGHRAPIADQLLRLRNVETQTPSELLSADRSTYSATSSFDESTGALPIIPGSESDEDDSFSSEAEDGEMSSEDGPGGGSPYVCFFDESQYRLPPDGREQKIDVKVGASEHWRGIFSTGSTTQSHVLGPPSMNPVLSPTKCHIPSERSAFCPLLKKYINHMQMCFQSSNGAANNTIEAQ